MVPCMTVCRRPRERVVVDLDVLYWAVMAAGPAVLEGMPTAVDDTLFVIALSRDREFLDLSAWSGT